MRKRMNIMKMLSVSTSQKIVLKRLKKTPARPRSSIGPIDITKQCAWLYTGRYHITFVFSLTCGRAKTIRIPYVWTGENDSNTLRVDANFFKNGEKPPFSKISAYVWTGPKSYCNIFIPT